MLIIQIRETAAIEVGSAVEMAAIDEA